MNQLKRATIINIFTNIFLVFINLIFGFSFNSMSLISKGFESFYDVITSIIIFISVRIGNKKDDEKHQFGHSRIENILAYTIGILMILLGFKLIEEAYYKFLNPLNSIYSNYLLFVIFLTFFVKLGLYFYIRNVLKNNNSPSLKANMQDHLNDMILIFGVFIAVIGVKYGYNILDPIISILISLLIIKSGFSISKENFNYLMGKSIDENKLREIKNNLLKFNEIKCINLIKSQYLGNKIQLEIHIGMDERLNVKEAHNIANKIRNKLLERDDIISCFIHIDPFKIK